MNAAATAVAGDWGTSQLRLFLCRDEAVLASAHGPGIAALSSSAGPGTETRHDAFRTVLSQLVAPWFELHGNLPVWLAGMVGSRNGWREIPYVTSPADAVTIAQHAARVAAEAYEITLVPGMRCVNARGAPDVMRGEETQVIGALVRERGAGHGPTLLVLPGTHTKWVAVQGERITRFQTAFSGELFRLLHEHSMLARAAPAAAFDGSVDRGGFESGLARCHAQRGVPLTHLLFEVRSRQLLAQMSADVAIGFLSGLIIGQDVQGGLASFGAELGDTPSVILIGETNLVELYRVALAAEGTAARTLDAATASVAGLNHLMSVAGRAGSVRAPAT